MTEEIHVKDFETLFEVRLDVDDNIYFTTGESAFTLRPDEVMALMTIIRSSQVWDSSVDLERDVFQSPWYRMFQKLKTMINRQTGTERRAFVRTLFTNDGREYIYRADGEIPTQNKGGD